MKKIEEGVFNVPLILSDSLIQQEGTLKKTIIQAQKNIMKFAKKNNWESLINSSFIKRVEIYDSQAGLIKGLIKNFDLDPFITLPKELSAVLEDEILMSISPNVYKELFPIEGNDSNGFERLLTHEIAHRLHIRILDGKEELMGPTWFFEGFAIFVAKQFPEFTCSKEIIWDIIENEKEVSYKYYAPIFRYLISHISIVDLINHAGNNNFINWLKSKIK